MAVGKNKRKPKQKRKYVDPFLRKQWYSVKAPGMFKETFIGRTPVNKTAANKLSKDALMGRVFKVSLGDLNNDEDNSFRYIHLIVEDVQGDEVLTNFHGMSFASHKLKSLVRKWRTLIEAIVDLTTSDGYKLRIFVIAFTKKRPNQNKNTAYATTAQIKQIRKKIFEIVNREAAGCDLKALVKKLIFETISARVEIETQGIYPLHNVFAHKMKILNKPAFDRFKLAEVHAETYEDYGTATRKTEDDEQYIDQNVEDDPSILGAQKHAFTPEEQQY